MPLRRRGASEQPNKRAPWAHFGHTLASVTDNWREVPLGVQQLEPVSVAWPGSRIGFESPRPHRLIAIDGPPVTIEGMNAAIVVILILLAIGIVVAPLLRLKKWLNSSPPGQEFQPPLDDGSE